jgi:hypothetical protein
MSVISFLKDLRKESGEVQSQGKFTKIEPKPRVYSEEEKRCLAIFEAAHKLATSGPWQLLEKSYHNIYRQHESSDEQVGLILQNKSRTRFYVRYDIKYDEATYHAYASLIVGDLVKFDVQYEWIACLIKNYYFRKSLPQYYLFDPRVVVEESDILTPEAK